MHRTITIEESVEMAIRRPTQSHILLAKTLAKVMNDSGWIDRNMKKKFCAMFINNSIDHSEEKEVDKDLLEKIKYMPLPRGIRLLKRSPEAGLKVLVVLVAKELEHQQKLTHREQFEFYDEIFGSFFPEITVPAMR